MIGQTTRRFAADDATGLELALREPELSREAQAHRARPQDQHVARRKLLRDVRHEPVEVLEAMRSPHAPGWSGGPVPDCRAAGDPAGRAMMARHIRLIPLEDRPRTLPSGHDRRARVDPDNGS
jgi:hypothetical protein